MEPNKDILRVILITDIPTDEYKLPSNLICISRTLDDIRKKTIQILQKELHTEVTYSDILIKSYKLCDLRPLYYLIFDDIIELLKIRKNIDYIGYGDCDVIYGKLSKFVDFKKNYYFIGGKGHFTSILMNDEYLSVWKKCEGYKYCNKLIDMFVAIDGIEKPRYFDENIYIYKLYELYHKKNTYFEFYDSYCDVVPPTNHPELEAVGKMRAQEKKIIKYFKYSIRTGELTASLDNDNIVSVSYVHLQKRNMNVTFNSYDCDYYITNNSFKL